VSQKVIRCPDDKLALLLEHGGLNCTSEAKAVAHGIMLDLRDCRAALAAAEAALADVVNRCGLAELAVTQRDIALADERRHADALKEGLAACVGERATFYAGQTQTVTWAVAIEHAERLLSEHRARRAAEVAPKAAPAKRTDGGPFGKWEIEPAITSEFDLTCTNDDNEAFDIAERVLERLWDEMEPGDTRTLRITLNAEVANGSV
jgi:hypothetical protein